MKKITKVIAIVLVLALSCVMLAGCGQKGSTVASVQKAGKLVMLTNAAFAPFEYLDNNGNVAGVDVDVANAIADKLGVELQVVDMDFDGIPAAIQAGKGDLGLAGMSIKEERKKYVDFSDPYVDTTICIVVKDDSPIATVDDLAGKQLGVQLGTTSDLFASDLDATVNRFKTSPDAVSALLSDKIDAVIVDQLPAEDAVSNNEGLIILAEPLTHEQYAIAIPKESDLTDVVNEVLSELMADGTIDELVNQHMELSKKVG